MRTILSALLCVAASAALAGPPPTLKPEVTVSSAIVLLGDLVANAGPAASAPVFRAPDLGTTGTVQAHRVIAAARDLGVDVAAAGIGEVAVTRASRRLPRAEIEAAIAEAVAAELGTADARQLLVRFDGDLFDRHVDPAGEGPLQVARLGYSRRSGRFEATLTVGSPRGIQVASLKVSGAAFEAVEVAAMARAVERGQVLRAEDLRVEKLPKTDAASDYLGLAEVVGLAAQRALPAGQAIRSGDVAKPDLVARNGIVTIVYAVPGLVLTVRGKSLEAGARGASISVLNLQSKRTIQAVVTAPGRVEVAGLGVQAGL